MLAKLIHALMIGYRNPRNKVSKDQPDGFLAPHCNKWTCQPLFSETVILGKSTNEMTRVIIEAQYIALYGDVCVNKSSIALSIKNLKFRACHKCIPRAFRCHTCFFFLCLHFRSSCPVTHLLKDICSAHLGDESIVES